MQWPPSSSLEPHLYYDTMNTTNLILNVESSFLPAKEHNNFAVKAIKTHFELVVEFAD